MKFLRVYRYKIHGAAQTIFFFFKKDFWLAMSRLIQNILTCSKNCNRELLETKNQNEESKSELSKFKQCPTLDIMWHNFYCPIATNDFYRHASNAIGMLACWKTHVISNTVLKSFTHKKHFTKILLSVIMVLFVISYQ